MVSNPSQRRLTDAVLLTTEFRYRNPEASIAGLNRARPDHEANPVIIGYYDETPAGGLKANRGAPRIWCCHCAKHSHWVGRVVRDDKGQTYIIGASKCGREHYGDKYLDAERMFRGERDRRVALQRWDAASHLVDGYAADIRAILAWPGLSEIERKRDEIIRASPAAHRKLQRYLGTDTEMVAHWQERDLAAEVKRQQRYEAALATHRTLHPDQRRALRDQGLAPQPDDSQIWTSRQQPLGHVTGGDFLRSDCDPRMRARELAATLDSYRTIQREGTDDQDVTTLTRLLQALAVQPQALLQAVRELASTDIFFSGANLDRLEQWTRGETRFSYARDEDRLVVWDPLHGQSTVTRPRDTNPPKCNALSASAALDGDLVLKEAETA